MTTEPDTPRMEAETEAERRLLAAVATGEAADCSGVDEKEKTVRGALLRDLCVRPDIYRVHEKGVQLTGATVTGSLDLEAATLPRPMVCTDCTFAATVQLSDARTRNLGFFSCTLPGLKGDRLRVDGTLALAGRTVTGGVSLLGAKIVHEFSCEGATFANKGGKALNADRLKVGGGVFLDDGFTATGEVRLLDADIGGGLKCSGATFANKGGDALSADRLKVGGGVFLDDGFTATGEVRLLGADIKGDLACVGGTFTNDNDALKADGLKVSGTVFLNKKFKATGTVRLPGADIGGNLECDGATFTNKDGTALSAEGATIGGNVFLREGFTATGQVSLLRAAIGGNLDCRDATFDAANSPTKSSEAGPRQFALSADWMDVGGQFFWCALSAPPKGDVNLRHARTGPLADDGSGWPEDGGWLHLDGFEYSDFANHTDMDVTKRIEWLGRQPPGVFSPQAHEQAAKVYRAAGRTSDARAILIDKEKRLQEARGGASKVWHGLLGLLIAYGYKPWRVGWPIGGVIAVGWAFAWCAFDNGHMVPAKERIFMHTCYNTRTYPCSDWTATPLRDGRVLRLPADYTEFNSFVYAVDTFFPIVDLHQEDNWNPRSDGFWGGVYRAWLWLHIALGWFLTTIAVVGLTGIIKKEDK